MDQKLKIRSHAVDFVYFDSKRPSKLKVNFDLDDEFYCSSKRYKSLKILKEDSFLNTEK